MSATVVPALVSSRPAGVPAGPTTSTVVDSFDSADYYFDTQEIQIFVLSGDAPCDNQDIAEEFGLLNSVMLNRNHVLVGAQ